MDEGFRRPSTSMGGLLQAKSASLLGLSPPATPPRRPHTRAGEGWKPTTASGEGEWDGVDQTCNTLSIESPPKSPEPRKEWIDEEAWRTAMQVIGEGNDTSRRGFTARQGLLDVLSSLDVDSWNTSILAAEKNHELEHKLKLLNSVGELRPPAATKFSLSTDNPSTQQLSHAFQNIYTDILEKLADAAGCGSSAPQDPGLKGHDGPGGGNDKSKGLQKMASVHEGAKGSADMERSNVKSRSKLSMAKKKPNGDKALSKPLSATEVRNRVEMKVKNERDARLKSLDKEITPLQSRIEDYSRERKMGSTMKMRNIKTAWVGNPEHKANARKEYAQKRDSRLEEARASAVERLQAHRAKTLNNLLSKNAVNPHSTSIRAYLGRPQNESKEMSHNLVLQIPNR